jgi:hypothetical protein
MKNRLLISLFLALGCGHAMAEWIKISSSEQSIFYMDSAVSQKVGDNVMVWLLRDHTTLRYGDSGPYQSSKDQIEVDCRRMRIRRVYSSDHPRHMGQGNYVHSEHGPMSWNDATPNTISRRIVDVACMNR